jgi:GDPmannose 4,6-dehydratase
MPPRALITGILGQDGSYLAELLLGKGYEVYGTDRDPKTERFERIKHIQDRIKVLYADVGDAESIDKAIVESEPDEIYNLAARSLIKAAWDHPVRAADLMGLGTTRLLESVRKINPKMRVFNASSAEVFGRVQEIPQKETTPFNPRSPYGAAKQYAFFMTKNYRESFNIHCASGILFNHESPRRSPEFVTRKITCGVAKIKLGLGKKLFLGNIQAKRDWGFAGDYVRAMWMMLQADEPNDFVVATGESHSVQELLQIAFERAGLNWEDHVQIDSSLIRSSDPDYLVGDSSRIRKTLGWKPTITFSELIEMMVDADIADLKKNLPEGS